MKNILLPTDLSVASLYPIHEICKSTGNGQCNIYLIHTLETPTGLDLIFLKEKKLYKEISPAFREAIEMLREKYAAVINRLSFEFVFLHSKAYLRNYMEGRNIDAIYMLEEHDYNSGLKQSANVIPTLHKCNVPVIQVRKTNRAEVGTYTTLFYKEKMPA